MDLQAEWMRRLAHINAEFTPEQIVKAVEIKAKEREAKELKETEKRLETYSIYKRSLPVGINKPVLFGLLKEEADKFIKKKNRTRIIQKGENEINQIIYYEKVKEDGQAHSVFENEYTKDTLLIKNPFEQKQVENSYRKDINWQD